MSALPPSVPPYGEKIRDERKKSGWTQDDLARKAGVNIKTIQRAEKPPEDGVRISVTFLTYIAEALGLTFAQLAWPDNAPGSNIKFWIDEMEQADKLGDYATATRLGESLVGKSALLATAHPLYADACVRLAIAYDHLHLPSVALAVLDRCLAAANETPATGGFMWAQYQRGVISRTSAEDLLAHSGWRLTEPIAKLLQQAEDDLKQVRSRGGVEWQVSADHHLGVIEMLRGNHHQALGTFQDCLRHREQNKATCSEAHCAPHRQAFEHRRIAQCHARIAADATKAQRQKELACAAHHFTQARQLASVAKHARLLYELDRDVQAWGIEQKANHHAH